VTVILICVCVDVPVTGALAGVTTAYPDREFVSRRAAADFAVSAGRCGCRESVNVRLHRCSAGRRCVRHSHGGSTAHLQYGASSRANFVVVTSLC